MSTGTRGVGGPARFAGLVVWVSCTLACGEPPSETAGTSGTGAGSGGAGTGSENASGAAAPISGTGSGGAGVSGGAASAAGSAAGGAPDASGPSIDAAVPGPDASADASGDASTPRASAGCGLSDPDTGLLAFEVQGQQAEYVLSIPSDYDPSRAYPLGFGFHGRNRTGPNCHDGDCAGFQDAMQDHAVLVYMTALGGTGWEGDGEREINVAFFQALRAHVEASYCIDTARVFVAGTSSGAHFVNVLGCRFGDRLLAVSPVAGYVPERDCTGPVAALVIHGVDDQLSVGEDTRDFYLERNHCDSTSVPAVADLHPRVVDNRESHECAVYDGCDPGKPVVFCEHSEGGYDGSTHGWPLFGGDEIWSFVQGL